MFIRFSVDKRRHDDPGLGGEVRDEGVYVEGLCWGAGFGVLGVGVGGGGGFWVVVVVVVVEGRWRSDGAQLFWLGGAVGRAGGVCVLVRIRG
ncbi:hypothetical protein BDV96DRAFT_573077 [Lophiotrema nucula]|uniref:Uncharacterized protein n=1 Tax=Lophiotrema nucula TaxID=690887 RepID=A0A6A5ZCZ1_9PLEO|nr:hypothetical protein BDV96DRAFT_573077 [Lophiotrema nucula]